MLKPAQLYKEQLSTVSVNTWYDLSYIYYYGGSGSSIIKVSDDNYNTHSFVSIDNNNIIGYMCYTIDWVAMSVDNFGIISFQKGNLEFIKDVYQAIHNIFKVYHMNRISWFCYADNPAIIGYRNFIRKHGGCQCGYERERVKLLDGKLHDTVMFEIMASEFH